SDRFDIRSEGSLTGDITAQRVSIEEGAYFKGGIDIRKPGQKPNGENKDEVPKVETATVLPTPVRVTG
ncbi:MAG: polymer-forming cytoskeletal protein, partial [Candidatus Korobacteraceae bacterium]